MATYLEQLKGSLAVLQDDATATSSISSNSKGETGEQMPALRLYPPSSDSAREETTEETEKVK